MTKRKYEGPKCGATNRSGKPCKRPAGWGTDHPGDGRCKLHGGAVQVKTGRYSRIKRQRIAELITEFRADPAPLDVTEELHLLRALILDYVERYDEITDLLQAWHNSYGPSYLAAIETWRLEYGNWREQMTDIYEDGWQDVEASDLPDPPVLPDPLEQQNKPRQVIDILSVGKFIVQIGALVDRIEKTKQEGAVSLQALDQYLSNLGEEVVAAAREVIDDDAIRTQLLSVVSDKWRIVKLGDRAPGPGEGNPAGAREVN